MYIVCPTLTVKYLVHSISWSQKLIKGLRNLKNTYQKKLLIYVICVCYHHCKIIFTSSKMLIRLMQLYLLCWHGEILWYIFLMNVKNIKLTVPCNRYRRLGRHVYNHHWLIFLEQKQTKYSSSKQEINVTWTQCLQTWKAKWKKLK